MRLGADRDLPLDPEMIGWRAFVALLAATTIAYSVPAHESARQTGWVRDPGTGCRFVPPASLATGPTYWIGECPNGRANGLGMLRRRTNGVAGHAFYGMMTDGIPVIGAVDKDGSFRVGRFAHGDIGPGTTPQENLDGFRTAVNAARTVSRWYATQGNAASADFYVKVAANLELQIE